MPIRILNIRYIYPWIFPRKPFTVFRTNGEYYIKFKIRGLKLSVTNKSYNTLVREFKTMISLAIFEGNLQPETRRELREYFDIGFHYLLLELIVWFSKSYIAIILAPLWVINSIGGRR